MGSRSSIHAMSNKHMNTEDHENTSSITAASIVKKKISTSSSQLQQILSNKLQFITSIKIYTQLTNKHPHNTTFPLKKKPSPGAQTSKSHEHIHKTVQSKTNEHEPSCEQGENKNWGYDIQHQGLLKELP